MNNPREHMTTATHTVRERQYEIRRTKDTYTDQSVYDVVDIETGLVLSAPSFITEPVRR
jgi:hypothetical protein